MCDVGIECSDVSHQESFMPGLGKISACNLYYSDRCASAILTSWEVVKRALVLVVPVVVGLVLVETL